MEMHITVKCSAKVYVYSGK